MAEEENGFKIADIDWGVRGEGSSDEQGGTVFGSAEAAVPLLGKVEGEFTFAGLNDMGVELYGKKGSSGRQIELALIFEKNSDRYEISLGGRIEGEINLDKGPVGEANVAVESDLLLVYAADRLESGGLEHSVILSLAGETAADIDLAGTGMDAQGELSGKVLEIGVVYSNDTGVDFVFDTDLNESLAERYPNLSASEIEELADAAAVEALQLASVEAETFGYDQIYLGAWNGGAFLDHYERVFEDKAVALNLAKQAGSENEANESSTPSGNSDLLPETNETVRRQGFWHQRLRKLREGLAHLVGLIMRRACGDASDALLASSV